MADALCRQPQVSQLATMMFPPVLDIEEVKKEVSENPHLAQTISKLKEDLDSAPRFFWHQETLLYKERLVIAKKSPLIKSLLQAYHDSVIRGHSGFLRTY